MWILLIQLQFLPIFLWKCVKNLNLMVFASFYQRLYIFSNKNEIIREYFLVDYVITISEILVKFLELLFINFTFLYFTHWRLRSISLLKKTITVHLDKNTSERIKDWHSNVCYYIPQKEYLRKVNCTRDRLLFNIQRHLKLV